jgi:uncharacterized protein YodC (DUF2158 family)
MEAKDLKVGDIVSLNSSSPKMTVVEINATQHLKLIYWNAHTFKFEELQTIASTVFKSAKKA